MPSSSAGAPPAAIADRLARFVVDTRLSAIDAAVIERTKDLLISAVGSAVLGATMAVPRAMAEHVRARGEREEASVFGFGFRTSIASAAMLNCDSSHCTELEDVAWPEAQYTCCILPAAVTMGEALGASGAQVIEATIIGFEVAARPGMTCSNGGAAARGWLSCANVGTIGAAAMAAKLMGLDFERTRAALTLAASMGGGLVRQTGSSAHVLEAGFAARDGIEAAQLAARGMGGNPAIFDGVAGYFDALAGQPGIDFVLGSGSDFRIMAVGQKKYPCCYMLQRIIDGTRELVQANGVVADDVVEAEVEVNGAFPRIMKYPEPRDVEEARFSLPHVVAATLSGEGMGPATFSEARLDAPAILALRDRVRMTVHDEWGFDQLGESDLIHLSLGDGRKLSTRVTIAKGDAVLPLTREETAEKFLRTTETVLDPAAATRLLGALERLDRLNDVGPLVAELSGARDAVAA